MFILLDFHFFCFQIEPILLAFLRVKGEASQLNVVPCGTRLLFDLQSETSRRVAELSLASSSPVSQVLIFHSLFQKVTPLDFCRVLLLGPCGSRRGYLFRGDGWLRLRERFYNHSVRRDQISGFKSVDCCVL